MKVCITGPAGSGKTYMAGVLSKKYKIPAFNLDEIFYIFLPNKTRNERKAEERTEILNNIFKEKAWIIEGLHPVKEVFEKADIIIWLKIPFYNSLFQQWKRYFSDKKQRKNYGFVNNLKLSIHIFNQYFGEPTPQSDPKRNWIKNVIKELKPYKDKVIIIKSNYEKNMFIKMT